MAVLWIHARAHGGDAGRWRLFRKGSSMKTRQMAIALAMATSAALLVTGCSGGSGPKENAAGPDFTAKITGSMTAGGFTLGDEVATSRADYAAAQLGRDRSLWVCVRQALVVITR